MALRPYLKPWDGDPTYEDRLRSAAAVVGFVLSSDEVTERHCRRVVDDALWYLTEGAGKYACRYRSAGVLTLEKGGPIKSWRSLLRHEHVVTRASLIADMLAAPERVSEILRTAVACVVTPAEHEQLSPHENLNGWARYVAGAVDVYDMATSTPVIVDGRFVNGGPT